MAWCCPGDKPLSEPMIVSLLMHTCVTLHQCLKNNNLRLQLQLLRGQWVDCNFIQMCSSKSCWQFSLVLAMAWCLSSNTTPYDVLRPQWVNTVRPEQNGWHSTDISKCIFLKENICTLIPMTPKFVPKGPIYSKPSLVQVMACWRGDKPLPEPMMTQFIDPIWQHWVACNIVSNQQVIHSAGNQFKYFIEVNL